MIYTIPIPHFKRRKHYGQVLKLPNPLITIGTPIFMFKQSNPVKMVRKEFRYQIVNQSFSFLRK